MAGEQCPILIIGKAEEKPPATLLKVKSGMGIRKSDDKGGVYLSLCWETGGVSGSLFMYME